MVRGASSEYHYQPLSSELVKFVNDKFTKNDEFLIRTSRAVYSSKMTPTRFGLGAAMADTLL